jgi:hypothetical protein
MSCTQHVRRRPLSQLLADRNVRHADHVPVVEQKNLPQKGVAFVSTIFYQRKNKKKAIIILSNQNQYQLQDNQPNQFNSIQPIISNSRCRGINQSIAKHYPKKKNQKKIKYQTTQRSRQLVLLRLRQRLRGCRNWRRGKGAAGLCKHRGLGARGPFKKERRKINNKISKKNQFKKKKKKKSKKKKKKERKKSQQVSSPQSSDRRGFFDKKNFGVSLFRNWNGRIGIEMYWFSYKNGTKQKEKN